MFQAMSRTTSNPIQSGALNLISYRLFRPKFERGVTATGANRSVVGCRRFAVNDETVTLPSTKCSGSVGEKL